MSSDSSTLFVRRTDVLEARIDDTETVLMSPAKGSYYGLDGAGVRIWDALEEPQSLDDLTLTLMETFDVDAATCARDTSRLLDEMLDEGLIERASRD